MDTHHPVLDPSLGLVVQAVEVALARHHRAHPYLLHFGYIQEAARVALRGRGGGRTGGQALLLTHVEGAQERSETTIRNWTVSSKTTRYTFRIFLTPLVSDALNYSPK